MDSVTQAALGAAVGHTVLGRQIGGKALAWGALVATLPDLDVLVPLGDDVADFTGHRSFSHSFVVQTVTAPLLAWAIGYLQRSSRPFLRGRLALAYLCLVTHALVDALTVYGTQLWWPLSVPPTTGSTIFIIDPAYTAPLLIGVAGALIWRRTGGHRFNAICLVISTAYLLFTVLAKVYVDQITERTLAAQSIEHRGYLSMASPFNALLWRVVVIDDDGYYEGYRSLFDDSPDITFRRFPGNYELLADIQHEHAIQRLQWFTKGFYGVRQVRSQIHIVDLRMGFEPAYVFGFVVGERRGDRIVATDNRRVDSGPDVMTAGWVWHRIWDERLEMP